VNLDCIGLANSLSYWTFTDIFEEKGGAETIFHGGFGMINFQGIVKPSYHAYRMLHQLGDENLYYSEPLFVSRSSKTGKISAVAYNYPKEFSNTVPSNIDLKNYMQASSKTLNVVLKNLPKKAHFEIEILDNENGNIKPYFDKMGAPKSPTREQTADLKTRAFATKKSVIQSDNNGNLFLNIVLTPWECMSIREL
jgi:xylan 1,4-beta-xylosidase